MEEGCEQVNHPPSGKWGWDGVGDGKDAEESMGVGGEMRGDGGTSGGGCVHSKSA